MRHPRIATLTALLGGLVFATATLAGGGAQVTLTDVPHDPPAGTGVLVGFEVMQHGETPVSWPKITVVATNTTTGDIVRTAATAQGAGRCLCRDDHVSGGGCVGHRIRLGRPDHVGERVAGRDTSRDRQRGFYPGDSCRAGTARADRGASTDGRAWRSLVRSRSTRSTRRAGDAVELRSAGDASTTEMSASPRLGPWRADHWSKPN